ncbi:uncharacterized protein GGS22DRAFT_196013 [Annulohypoxylon maeteangense]|uniref:uncharacterized protein n=1 Tax=Annulohypoxylon maeteangense TaxID=1927788 RepID=UPI00200884B4|nr:uncharacterized protein GGS22DRAFT_196013 [Annulohypoxylon maeteangense]KAI0882300.1 hypothetical protein GGS22DRAFT_196013 [Annulohypoxylon maeteangense]
MAPTKNGKPDKEVFYFAYGSNLSPAQMLDRCPSSPPIGLAHLSGWTWLINERGYANIIQEKTATPVSSSIFSHSSTFLHNIRLSAGNKKDKDSGEEKGLENRTKGGVYGIVYRLHPSDEVKLDMCEGVPWAYQRQFLDATLLPALTSPTTADKDDTHDYSQDVEKEKTVRVLVYIDPKRILPSAPRKEYVYRMNRGIDEAMEHWGLPKLYVDSIMRPFIPARSTG